MDLSQAKARLLQSLRLEITDEKVLAAMERVPREAFVLPSLLAMAYDDIPLPIGEGQTISQPFIVALMTQALELKGTEKVLEVGTGSGYQAAILAELVPQVISVERRPPLADRARLTLSQLGYTNVAVHLTGETLGWSPEAPYAGIIVTAAAPYVPQELLDQLVEGGRLVIPVGSRYDQDLLQVIKRGDKVSPKNLGACRFVPLIDKMAWKEEESS